MNEYDLRVAGRTERDILLEQRFKPKSIIIEDPNDNSCYNSSIVTLDMVEKERELKGSHYRSHLGEDVSIGSVRRVTDFNYDDNDSRHFNAGISEIHSS